MNIYTPLINDGGPAFPCEEQIRCGGEVVDTRKFTGMTLRDYFAGQAIGHIAQHAMVDGWARSGPEWRDGAAEEAYKFADAMIAAREVEP